MQQTSFWILLCTLFHFANGARVLFLPSSFHDSHAVPMKTLAEKLTAKGHEVDWVEYGPDKTGIELAKPIERQFWQVSVEQVHDKENPWQSLIITKDGRTVQGTYDGHTIPISNWMTSIEICDHVLTDHKDKFNALVQKGYDTVVIDDQFNPCGLLLAALKGSVFVYWSQSALRPESAWAHQSPSPPSYLPVPGTQLTDELDFWQRSYNLYAYLRALYVHQHIVQPRIDELFKTHYPTAPLVFSIERNASLNFVNTPPIFDFARPFMPRVVFVGCIHCRNATELPNEISSFLGSSKFMVASFGYDSLLSKAPEEILKQFFNALASRPSMKFVVQIEGALRPENKPSNVLALPWMPLQDLLGNPNCIAHISHGGLNSVVESVYHGVPVIGLPLIYPSYDNLLRITARGAGIIVEKEKMSIHYITEAIDKIQKKKYKDEMLIFQDMVRDVPYTELDHATFWIEFIERHREIPHARSGADHLNVLQYFLVDVVLFVASIIYVFFYVVYTVIRFTLRLCCGRKTTVKSKRE